LGPSGNSRKRTFTIGIPSLFFRTADRRSELFPPHNNQGFRVPPHSIWARDRCTADTTTVLAFVFPVLLSHNVNASSSCLRFRRRTYRRFWKPADTGIFVLCLPYCDCFRFPTHTGGENACSHRDCVCKVPFNSRPTSQTVCKVATEGRAIFPFVDHATTSKQCQ